MVTLRTTLTVIIFLLTLLGFMQLAAINMLFNRTKDLTEKHDRLYEELKLHEGASQNRHIDVIQHTLRLEDRLNKKKVIFDEAPSGQKDFQGH